ncbi:unnamed protein product [Ilex paraguariensis]|uniref:Uncharacterized protein n=1 Tax=Ilex paraguariensis TaxID=185542 RepID=A0ABC8RXI7_9AQUA
MVNETCYRLFKFVVVIDHPQPQSRRRLQPSSLVWPESLRLPYPRAQRKRKEEEMSVATSLGRFHSPFLCSPLKLSSSLPCKSARNHRSPASYPCVRALDLDLNTVVAITVGVVSIAVGVGIPVFYETQIDNAAKRDNTQPCFPCDGSGARK